MVEAGADDRHARVCVVDRDGLRVQVLTLEGRIQGAIPLESLVRGRTAQDRRSRGKKGGR